MSPDVTEMRARFRELLERAAAYVRDKERGEWRDRLLGDIAVFSRAADFHEEREALHAFEKSAAFHVVNTFADTMRPPRFTTTLYRTPDFLESFRIDATGHLRSAR